MKITRIPVGPFATNCILIEDEATRETIVVDPGFDGGALADRIRAAGMKPVLVLLTHGHMDHCLDAAAVATRFDVPIALHADDLPLYRNLALQVSTLLGSRAAERYGLEEPLEPTVLLKDGDTVKAGTLAGEVLHLPGHSPGGVGVLFRGEDPPVLLAGDTLFRDGVGRTDLWGGSWETLLASIRGRLFTLPPETRVLTGHGGETTIGREKSRFAY